MSETYIEISSLVNHFGDKVVHEHIDFQVKRGEVVCIVGGSGSGKTVLLHSMLMLRKPTQGTVKLFGKDIFHVAESEIKAIRRRIGVAFQYNALFTSLNVLENVRFPLDEFTQISKAVKNELALLKLKMVGLKIDDAYKLPAELSGGMQKRAALARAISLEPDILFLDEPTSGLDPINARNFDKLVQKLREMLGLTVIMVTHDRQSLEIADRVTFLGEGRVLADESVGTMKHNSHPEIQAYFRDGSVSGEQS